MHTSVVENGSLSVSSKGNWLFHERTTRRYVHPPLRPPLRLLLFALFHFSLPTCTCQLAAAGSHCSYNVNWTLFHKEDIKCYLAFHFYFNKKYANCIYVLNCTDLETLRTINSSLHYKLDQRHEIERDMYIVSNASHSIEWMTFKSRCLWKRWD